MLPVLEGLILRCFLPADAEPGRDATGESILGDPRPLLELRIGERAAGERAGDARRDKRGLGGLAVGVLAWESDEMEESSLSVVSTRTVCPLGNTLRRSPPLMAPLNKASANG
mmetsp:Transcript_79865/g.220840  ORF Transcript_79865/g.220840 Transcript_79865/m.220840 type:complete len:113 (-) Transcript_79865:229-567(-)